MALPKEDTDSWQEEIEFYLSSTRDQRDGRARELGMKDRLSYEARMRERNIHLSDGRSFNVSDDERVVVSLPPVKLLEPRIHKDVGDDEEIMVLHCSDGHAAKITKSFNGNVYKDRMYMMFESAMEIVRLHRNLYPVKKLYILNTGDNCQGENVFQGSTIGTTEMGARDQVNKLAAPIWNDVIGSFKQQFDEVIFEGFPGNHGYERLAPTTSRLDLFLYDVLQAGIGNNPGIKVNVHEEFADVININGFRFFCFHGDGIPCQQGIPYFAIDRALKAWYIQFGGFSYACGGHFHKRHSDEMASKIEYFMCGSLVSDDDWALQKMKISSNPSQWIYGVHARYGVTFRYPLVVDSKFLPESNKNE